MILNVHGYVKSPDGENVMHQKIPACTIYNVEERIKFWIHQQFVNFGYDKDIQFTIIVNPS